MLKQFIQILIGLILLIVMLFLLIASWGFWQSTLHVIKGGIIFLLFFIGIGLLFIGFSELK